MHFVRKRKNSEVFLGERKAAAAILNRPSPFRADGAESGLNVLFSTWRIMRVFCVSKMNVLFTKFLLEQATEGTGNLPRSLSMFSSLY